MTDDTFAGGNARLPTVVELKPSDDVDAKDIIEVLEKFGYETRFTRQTHDTIRDVELLSYNIEMGESGGIEGTDS